MKNKCDIKILYKPFASKTILKDNLFKIENFAALTTKIITKTKKYEDEITNGVKEGDKFILKLEEKISGIDSIFDDRTLEFLRSKISEDQIQFLTADIIKVDKYPEWKPPQIFKIFNESLEKESKKVLEGIKKDLILEELENGNRVYLKEKKEENELSEDNFRECHICIFCNNCQRGNFFGFRYVCAECNNYNLCEQCYSNEIYTHDKEHVFIRIKNPIHVDLNNYSSIFSPNRKYELRKLEIFDIKIDIINNGINDLKNCFISPIRFGKEYLGCVRKTITDDVKAGEKTSVEVCITFDEDYLDDQKLKQYKGYYRLMTEHGIPFGDVLYLELDIKDN